MRAPLWWPGIVTAGGLLTAGVLAALGAAFPLVDFADEGPAAGLATGGLDDPGPDDPGFGMDVTGPDDAGFGGMSGEVPFEESLWSGPGPGASDLPGAFGLVPLDSWLPVTAGAVLTLLAGLIAVFAVARTGHAVVTATRVAAALSTGVLVTGSFLVLRSVFSLTAWFGALGAELGNPLPSPSAGAGAILLLVASVVALVGMVLSWGPVPRRTIGGAFPGIAPHPPLATEPRQLPKEDDQ
ncbi:hypothetical protein LV75_005536 [Actinokineospora diospyrosa]|uniref:Uncharacterized protein n=1 Tax=Actinokineospora diospyrosa TaxID=103728 RepID=A0ABT1IK42_9PSEU|nr:hypothetical protein [Actinokineospora diospyrosa]